MHVNASIVGAIVQPKLQRIFKKWKNRQRDKHGTKQSDRTTWTENELSNHTGKLSIFLNGENIDVSTDNYSVAAHRRDEPRLHFR